MNPPATESAVQTTPPMMSALTIPPGPVSPTWFRTMEESMSVISVIPETGFVPTIAVAFAATVVKRNDMIRTMRSPARACARLKTTPA